MSIRITELEELPDGQETSGHYIATGIQSGETKKYKLLNILQRITSLASTVATHYNTMISRTAANTTKITNNTSAISSNTSAISSNLSKIDTNTSAISSNTSAISSNTSTISSNTSAISSNLSKIDTNTTAIATTTMRSGLYQGEYSYLLASLGKATILADAPQGRWCIGTIDILNTDTSTTSHRFAVEVRGGGRVRQRAAGLISEGGPGSYPFAVFVPAGENLVFDFLHRTDARISTRIYYTYIY